MAASDTIYQTILFADIAGSTLLYDKLGDVRALSLVTSCIELMNTAVKTNKGKVVKTIGDEVMGRFDTPDAAAMAAVSLQEMIFSNAELTKYNIQLRIGLHHGSVIEEEDDIFGDAVNVAARMAGQAKGGQIITSQFTLDMLKKERAATARLVDKTRVKGKHQVMDIYELSWGQPEELTIIGANTGQIFCRPASPEAILTLDLHDQHISVSNEQPVVTLGRDAGNRIVINDPKVSRLHARIEMRRDKFILVDQSTNGTYIQIKNSDIIMLHRDEVTLQDEGLISLGHEVIPNSPLTIQFRSL